MVGKSVGRIQTIHREASVNLLLACGRCSDQKKVAKKCHWIFTSKQTKSASLYSRNFLAILSKPKSINQVHCTLKSCESKELCRPKTLNKNFKKLRFCHFHVQYVHKVIGGCSMLEASYELETQDQLIATSLLEYLECRCIRNTSCCTGHSTATQLPGV